MNTYDLIPSGAMFKGLTITFGQEMNWFEAAGFRKLLEECEDQDPDAVLDAYKGKEDLETERDEAQSERDDALEKLENMGLDLRNLKDKVADLLDALRRGEEAKGEVEGYAEDLQDVLNDDMPECDTCHKFVPPILYGPNAREAIPASAKLPGGLCMAHGRRIVRAFPPPTPEQVAAEKKKEAQRVKAIDTRIKKKLAPKKTKAA